MLKPSNKLRAYLFKARAWGLDPDAILASSGVSWDLVAGYDEINAEQRERLFDHIARRVPAAFAVRCGKATRLRDFGTVGFAMQSMPTLREAFRLWNRYSLVAGQPLITSMSETDDQWRMHFVPRQPMSADSLRFCLEVSIAALEAVIEEMTGSPPNTLAIDLSYPCPGDTGHYSAFCTRVIRFDHEGASYCGRRADLDRTIPEGDHEISEVLRDECEQFLARLTLPHAVSQRVADMIRVSQGRILRLDEIAAELGVSERSLQRGLEREGVSYQELVRDYRQKHATTLLMAPRPNVKEIAFMLGFADVGSFRRAFRQWTGCSIGEWHQRHALAQPIPMAGLTGAAGGRTPSAQAPSVAA